MLLSSLFLLLPLLAETVSAVPPPRRFSRSHFRRIYRQRADDAEFTGIPVATSTPDLSQLLPAASSIVSAEDPRATGNNTVPPSTSGISDEVVGSLLAGTASFADFQYTSYVPSPTSSASVAAQETGSSGGDPLGEIEKMAKSKADAMIGQMLPTLTLEVVLEPTQVSFAPLMIRPDPS